MQGNPGVTHKIHILFKAQGGRQRPIRGDEVYEAPFQRRNLDRQPDPGTGVVPDGEYQALMDLLDQSENPNEGLRDFFA